MHTLVNLFDSVVHSCTCLTSYVNLSMVPGGEWRWPSPTNCPILKLQCQAIDRESQYIIFVLPNDL